MHTILVVHYMGATCVCSENTAPPGARAGNHEFIMHSFETPTICDVCRKLLRGVFYQGYKCQCEYMTAKETNVINLKNK